MAEKIKKYISPLGRWFGGKFFLANKIIACMPEHECYCEAFAGAAWVYFKKPPSKIEIINDLNSDLVNFWKVVSTDPSYLVEQLETCLCSREIFEELRDMTADQILALTPREQAWRLFYICKCAFSGKRVCASTACVKQGDRAAGRPSFQIRKKCHRTGVFYLFNRARFREILLACVERMRNVQVENLSWQKCLAFYDCPTTFFYLDPPYINQLEAYGKNMFGMEDIEIMPGVLEKLQGKFLFSINDCELALKLFSPFHIYRTKAVYPGNSYCNDRGGKKTHSELFITNYPIPDEAVAKCNLLPIKRGLGD